MTEEEQLDYAIVQHIYEEQSWKIHPVDSEYLMQFFLSFCMINEKANIEELMIICDLNNVSFMHDKNFMSFMYNETVKYLNYCAEKDVISDITRDNYMMWLDKMRMKFWRFFSSK